MKRDTPRDKFVLILCLALAIPIMALGFTLFFAALGASRPLTGGGAIGLLRSVISFNSDDALWFAGISVVIASYLGFIALKAWREFDKESK